MPIAFPMSSTSPADMNGVWSSKERGRSALVSRLVVSSGTRTTAVRQRRRVQRHDARPRQASMAAESGGASATTLSPGAGGGPAVTS
jgi:hypothetical protein